MYTVNKKWADWFVNYSLWLDSKAKKLTLLNSLVLTVSIWFQSLIFIQWIYINLPVTSKMFTYIDCISGKPSSSTYMICVLIQTDLTRGLAWLWPDPVDWNSDSIRWELLSTGDQYIGYLWSNLVWHGFFVGFGFFQSVWKVPKDVRMFKSGIVLYICTVVFVQLKLTLLFFFFLVWLIDCGFIQ